MSKKKYRCVPLELMRKVEDEYPEAWEQMALRGGFKIARKIVRNVRDWCIENCEEYPDHRKKEKPDVNE